MEFETPLNKAHCQVRKSEKLLKTGKFDEAIALQDRIVELLTEALADAKDSKVHESLVLQIEYHTKQKQLIGHKQASWEHFCKQLANLQVKMSNVSGSAGSGDGLQVTNAMFIFMLSNFFNFELTLGFHISNISRN